MSESPAKNSTKSFLEMLERSGIVANNRLKKELANLAGRAAGHAVDIQQLSSHLIDSGLITSWHTEKLLAGKYKGFFLGKYKLLGHLGTGGMSSVYLAEHKISGQLRAIKVLPRKKVSDKSYLDRFYLEARAAASLDHPNVVRMYDILNEADTHYMVMEYVEGKDLYETVKESGPLPIKKAVEYTAQAAEGLAHAHERNLVHRDIKPANLLLTRHDQTVKILDLGLALVNQDDDESLTILYNERVMGTADYLSPEQAVNSHNVDLRADIYSLGCTLYFLLTGHPPFPKGTLAQRIALHQSSEPADIRESRPDCPEALVKICQQMMKKNPDERYQNCQAIKAELLGFLETGKQLGIGLSDSAGPFATDEDSDSPFAIDITGSSKSDTGLSTKKLSGSHNSSKRLVSNKRDVGGSLSHKSLSNKKTLSKATHTVRRRRKAPPKWLIPAFVASMMAILFGVLYFTFWFIQQRQNAPPLQPAAPAEPARSPFAQPADESPNPEPVQSPFAQPGDEQSSWFQDRPNIFATLQQSIEKCPRVAGVTRSAAPCLRATG